MDRKIKSALLETSSNLRNIPIPNPPTTHMFSDQIFKVLEKYVLDFQKKLDDLHDVGLLLTNFGESTLMEVREITYEKSVIMIFKGFVDGKEATLIQHISQLNFLLTTISKEKNKKKNVIGFIVSEVE